MKISELELSDERKLFLKNMCISVKTESVTITDGNVAELWVEITKINRKNIDRLWIK